MNNLLRQLLTGVRALAVLTLLLGVAYPVAVWGVAQLAFSDQADGSLATRDGRGVGSRLLGQTFQGDTWFASRPSAADYDAQASGGSNLGPNEGDLTASITERQDAVAKREGVSPADVPADAVTASASGLDPHISPEYATIQIARVARARGLPLQEVAALVAEHTSGRILGFLGEPRVNVLELNLALDARR